MAKTVVALFDDLRHAHRAVDDLRKSRHFTSEDITLMAHDANNRYSRHITKKYAEEHEGNKAGTGAAAGAGIGGIVGAIAGFLVGVGVIFVPGLGPIVAAGPLVSTLLGAASGAAAGGMIGGLIGLGIPESEAHMYAEGLRRGGTLVVVQADEAYAHDAVDILSRHKPVDIDERARVWKDAGWSGRFEPSRPPYNEAQIAKEREAIADTEPVQAAARMYPPIHPRDEDPAVYHDLESEFRRHFEAYHGSHARFEDYEEGYRFGASIGADDQFANASWDELEPRIRQTWPERSRGSWENFKEYVAYAWYRTKSQLFDHHAHGY